MSADVIVAVVNSQGGNLSKKILNNISSHFNVLLATDNKWEIILHNTNLVTLFVGIS